jgi:hypothetical protein
VTRDELERAARRYRVLAAQDRLILARLRDTVLQVAAPAREPS